MAWKKKLQKQWKKLVATVIALALVISAIFFNIDDGIDQCELILTAFENNEATLVEVYQQCGHVIDEALAYED